MKLDRYELIEMSVLKVEGEFGAIAMQWDSVLKQGLTVGMPWRLCGLNDAKRLPLKPWSISTGAQPLH